MGSPFFRMALVLVSIDVLLVGLYGVHLASDGRIAILDLDGERNLGSWWGGGKYLVAGVALLLLPIFAPQRCAAAPAFYVIAAAGLAFLSADEIIGVHERVTAFNRNVEAGIPMFNGTNGAWIALYAAIFVAFLIAFFRPIVSVARADPASARIFLAGFAVLLLGAVFVEILGYYDLVFSENVQVGVEEALELFGVSLMLLGTARHVHAGLSEAATSSDQRVYAARPMSG